MTDSQNPNAVSKQQNSVAIREKIRVFLASELAVDPDKVYINGVNNNEEKLVIYSESLSLLAWNRVYENDPLGAAGDTSGVFGVPYSYADEHRLSAPTWAQIAQAVNTLVEQLG